MLLFLLIFPFLSLCSGQFNRTDIANCPPLQELQTYSALGYRCFCELGDDLKVACIEGNATSMADAFSGIKEAGFVNITEFYSSGLYGDVEPINRATFHGIEIGSMTFFDCYGALQFEPDVFLDHRDSLTYFASKHCPFFNNSIPAAFRVGLHNLDILMLEHAILKYMPGNSFQGMSSLTELDLSSNLVEVMEPDIFKPLDKLQKLMMNYGSFGQTVPKLEYLKLIKNLTMIQASIKEVKPGLFDGLESLEYLDLTNNEIETTQADGFRGLTNLKDLRLNLNEINNTEPYSFRGMPRLDQLRIGGNFLYNLSSPTIFSGLRNLTFLELGYNNIWELTDGIFKEMPNLQVLDLQSNGDLGEIEPGAFEGLSNLRELNLANSGPYNLTTGNFRYLKNLEILNWDNGYVDRVEPGGFDGLESLETLYLNDTDLTTLPVGSFDPLVSLREIDTSDGLWNCDTNLTWMIDWFQINTKGDNPKVKILDKEHNTCDSPPHLRDFFLHNLNIEWLRPDGFNITNDTLKFELPFTGDPSTTTLAVTRLPGLGQIPREIKEPEKWEVGNAAPIVVGIAVALVIITAIVIIVVVTLRARKLANVGDSTNKERQMEPVAINDIKNNPNYMSTHSRNYDTATTIRVE